MVKKAFIIILAFLLIFTAACSNKEISANKIEKLVNENYEFILSVVSEMQSFKMDRVYVAIENTAEKDEENAGSETSEADEELHLVSYEKESGDRTKIDDPILEKAINELSLKLILFQTASDGRQSVIFAYSKEADAQFARGFYYSFDSLPCAWWGRKAKLKKDHDRFIEISDKNSAWYSTVNIKGNIFYYEKSGVLTA